MKRCAALLLALLLLLPATPGYAVSAALNQRMSTRSGPSTAYTEELGTLPQTTAITVIEQVMGSVPWALVEFTNRGAKYRAYTGMKRINAYGQVPWGIQEGSPKTLLSAAQVYYGPGEHYAPRKERLAAGAQVLVFGYENGFVLVDYPVGKQRARGYVSQSAIDGGWASSPSSSTSLMAVITLSNAIPSPGEELVVTFQISGGRPPYQYTYLWDYDIDYYASGTGSRVTVRYPIREGTAPNQVIRLFAQDAAGNETEQFAQYTPRGYQSDPMLFQVPSASAQAGNRAWMTVLAQYAPNVFMGYLRYEYRWVFESTGGSRTYTAWGSSDGQRRADYSYTPSGSGRLWMECRVDEGHGNPSTYQSPAITVR